MTNLEKYIILAEVQASQHNKNFCKCLSSHDIIMPEVKKKVDDFLSQSSQLTQIKSCPYLLPCGKCDKTNGEICSQYLVV